MLEAQQSLDAFAINVSDRRGRRGSTVGELGSSEPLRALPVLAFPRRRSLLSVSAPAARWSRLRPTTTASRRATPASR
jgi:hypothetical protein